MQKRRVRFERSGDPGRSLLRTVYRSPISETARRTFSSSAVPRVRTRLILVECCGVVLSPAPAARARSILLKGTMLDASMRPPTAGTVRVLAFIARLPHSLLVELTSLRGGMPTSLSRTKYMRHGQAWHAQSLGRQLRRLNWSGTLQAPDSLYQVAACTRQARA
jgi:hypothetical protein